jgi:hypothetical protein
VPGGYLSLLDPGIEMFPTSGIFVLGPGVRRLCTTTFFKGANKSLMRNKFCTYLGKTIVSSDWVNSKSSAYVTSVLELASAKFSFTEFRRKIDAWQVIAIRG